VREDYIQHNPNRQRARQAFEIFHSGISAARTPLRHRHIGGRRLVWVHAHQTTSARSGSEAIDIYRIQDGKCRAWDRSRRLHVSGHSNGQLAQEGSSKSRRTLRQTSTGVRLSVCACPLGSATFCLEPIVVGVLLSAEWCAHPDKRLGMQHSSVDAKQHCTLAHLLISTRRLF